MTTLPLFPLNTVLFPDGFLPLQVFEVRYLNMIKSCIADGQPFGVVPLLAGDEVRKPGAHETLGQAGTLARIVEWSAPHTGLLHVRCIGGTRFRLRSSTLLRHGLWMAEVEALPPDQALPVPPEQRNVADALGKFIHSLQVQGIPAGEMPLAAPFRLADCGWVANRWCELLPLGVEEKLRLLCQDSPVLRLELIADVLLENGMLD
jgi:Lon protease-like protein